MLTLLKEYVIVLIAPHYSLADLRQLIHYVVVTPLHLIVYELIRQSNHMTANTQTNQGHDVLPTSLYYLILL